MNYTRRLAFGGFVLAFCLWPGLLCRGAIDAYLKIERIEGESLDPDYVGYSEILSFSWEITRSGGLTQSKGLEILKSFDKASPKLAQACAGGTRLPRVTLVARRTEGERKVEFLKIVLTDVLVASCEVKFNQGETQLPGVPDGNPGLTTMPIEEVSLNFSIIEMFYQPVDAVGEPVGDVVEAMVWLPLTP